MFKTVLYRPEIPPNTGNIIRLCGNTETELHLIEPIGFELDERSVRRSALGYDELAIVKVHSDLDACLGAFENEPYIVTTNGETSVFDVDFELGDVFVFGNEGGGIPTEIEARFPHERRLKIPQSANSRSLNLANAVAIVLYEALRQNGFPKLH